MINDVSRPDIYPPVKYSFAIFNNVSFKHIDYFTYYKVV